MNPTAAIACSGSSSPAAPARSAGGHPGNWTGETAGPAVGLLASAVAEPGTKALLIAADNTSAGWVPIDEAVASGQAFAVVPRDGLVCLDFDPSSMTQRAAVRARAAFDAFTSEHPECVVVASGRPGHRHAFWAPSHDDAYVQRVVDGLRTAGIDHRTTAIRPPLSPHRTGLPVSLVHPVDHVAALAALGEAQGATVRISRRMLDMLRLGHETGGYESASHGRMALALAAVAAGAGPGWLTQVLEDPANALGASFRRRDQQWRAEEVDRLVHRARQRLKERHSRGDLALVATVLGAARGSAAFATRSGPTDLAVLEGLGRRALGFGHHPVACSVDDAAIAGGVHRDTAKRALRRLRQAGWVELAEAPTATRASVWALRLPPGSSTTTQHAKLDLGCDAARRGALGKARTRVYREVSGVPLRCAEIAARLGLAEGTVRRHLGALRRWGMVEPTRDGWVRTARTLEEVAVAAGTSGRGERQRRDYDARRRARAAGIGLDPPVVADRAAGHGHVQARAGTDRD
jgi:DNA-binding transcriptional ArsR family regulator